MGAANLESGETVAKHRAGWWAVGRTRGAWPQSGIARRWPRSWAIGGAMRWEDGTDEKLES